MISDVLSDAIDDIDRYLESPTFADTYCGELRQRIIELRDRMEAMRGELDNPPLDTELAQVIDRRLGEAHDGSVQLVDAADATAHAREAVANRVKP